MLAHLSHSNVVGYHSAWLEYVTTDNVGGALPSELHYIFCVLLWGRGEGLRRNVARDQKRRA